MRPSRPDSGGEAVSAPTRGSFALVLLLGAAGFAEIWFATAGFGPVVNWDSIAYLDFVANPGSDSPTMSLFCPLFPLLLNALGLVTGLTAPVAARLLNAILFGATVVLAATAVRSHTRWKWSPLLAALLVLTSRILLEQYCRVMSDPLALFLGFLGLHFTALFLDRPTKQRLTMAGICMGLALFTRYSTLPLATTAGLALLAQRNVRWRDRIFEAGAFAALASAPLAMWIGRNIGSTGSALNRGFQLRPPTPGIISRFLNELSTWLLPARTPAAFRFALLMLAAASVVWLALPARRTKTSLRSSFERLLFGSIVLFATFIAFVHLMVDTTVAAGTRHWLPVYFALLLLFVLLFDRAMSNPLSSAPSRRMLAAAVVVFLACSEVMAAGKAILLFRNGAEFSSRAMASSVVHRLAEPRWAARPIYASDPEGLRFVAGLESRRFPVKYFPMNHEPNKLYAAQVLSAVDALRNRNGLTVRLAGGYSPRLPSVAELEEEAGLVVVARDATATIYAAPGSGP